MPLKCLTADNKVVLAYQLSPDGFESLRAQQRAQHNLHFDCCDAAVGLRVSRRGLKHFYHLGGHGACPYEAESEAHLSLKLAVMLAAKKAGWDSECEVSSAPGCADRWRADVFAQRGSARIAIEIQLSNIPWDQIDARQERYRAAGVRGLWLLGAAHYHVSREVPAFQARVDGEGQWWVLVSPPDDDRYNVTIRKYPGHWVELETFVMAALSRNLIWAPALDINRVDVIIRAPSPVRCGCGAKLLLPTSLAISLPYPGHRSLLWAVLEYKPHTANPGPAWLNVLVEIFNRGYPERSGAVLATRHLRGRALHFYRCPKCGAEKDDVHTRQGETAITHRDLPVLGLLPEAQPGTAEHHFLYQWWLRAAMPEKPGAAQMRLDLR